MKMYWQSPYEYRSNGTFFINGKYIEYRTNFFKDLTIEMPKVNDPKTVLKAKNIILEEIEKIENILNIYINICKTYYNINETLQEENIEPCIKTYVEKKKLLIELLFVQEGYRKNKDKLIYIKSEKHLKKEIEKYIIYLKKKNEQYEKNKAKRIIIENILKGEI